MNWKLLAGILVIPWAIGCGASSGGDESPTTVDPDTSTSEAQSTETETEGATETETEGATESGGEVCEPGSVAAGSTVIVNTLPLEVIEGEETVTRALVACVVGAASTPSAVMLTCTGSDDAVHEVTITLEDGVPTALALVADTPVTLRYQTLTSFYSSCVFADDANVWFSLRDDADALLLGGARGESLVPSGADDMLVDMFAPFQLAIDESCAEVPGEGDCIETPFGVAVSTAEEPGITVLEGHEGEIAGTSFALDVGHSVRNGGGLQECCIEGGTLGIELLIVAVPD